MRTLVHKEVYKLENILKVQGLYKRYGEKDVLKNISFEIFKGDIIGLIGENGAGKTTLINTIAGIAKFLDGSIELCGRTVCHDREKYYDNLCIAFDQTPNYPHLSGETNLKLFSEDKGAIDFCLKLCELENAGKKKASKYSLGMKQRLNIARTLLTWSNLMIMDESLNGLDPGIVIEIKKYIKDCCKVNAKSVLISSHALKELLHFCNKYIFIKNGEIFTIIDKKIENFDISISLENEKFLDWLKGSGRNYLIVEKLNRIYLKNSEIIPKEFNVSKLLEETNILEDIYLRMRSVS